MASHDSDMPHADSSSMPNHWQCEHKRKRVKRTVPYPFHADLLAPRATQVTDHCFVIQQHQRRTCLLRDAWCVLSDIPVIHHVFDEHDLHKPRLSGHFCPRCGTRLFGWMWWMSAFHEAFCFREGCGTWGFTEDIVLMDPIALQDKPYDRSPPLLAS